MSHHHHHHDHHGHEECWDEHHHHHDECCSDDASHHEHGHEDFAQELIELADEAWMDVLWDKIKKEVEATSGAHLDKIAKLVTQSNKERWEHKLAKKKVGDDFREKLHELFSHKK